MSDRLRFVKYFLVAVLLAATGWADEVRQKVIWQRVREDGLVATYLRPKGDEILPAVLVLGGSEGGIKTAEAIAYRLAERGYAALAVAYFGIESLPKALANIPLEYFDGAAAWLKRQPRIDSANLAIVGASRGGELALLLASHNASFNRVIAFAPSYVVWGPVAPGRDPAVSAWTLGGRPLPFVKHAREPDYSRVPYHGTPDFLADLQQSAVVEAAAIPVEKIQGAVLLLSGDDDQLWPSTLMAKLVMKRLAAHAHPFRYEHRSFPDAGHLLVLGSDPGLTQAKHPIGITITFGGTRAGNLAAQEEGWRAVMEFLKGEIKAGKPMPVQR